MEEICERFICCLGTRCMNLFLDCGNKNGVLRIDIDVCKEYSESKQSVLRRACMFHSMVPGVVFPQGLVPGLTSMDKATNLAYDLQRVSCYFLEILDLPW